MELFFFFLFAIVAVASALALVLFRNPVNSALSLVTTLFCVAGLFVLLRAHFLAAVQIIVYAGAIMVLFLFVIMLLNLGHPEALESSVGRYRRTFVVVLSGLLVAQLGFLAGRHLGWSAGTGDSALVMHNVSYIGKLLYTEFLFPFEVASMILLVALIGVIVLVKRDRPKPARGARPGVEKTAGEEKKTPVNV